MYRNVSKYNTYIFVHELLQISVTHLLSTSKSIYNLKQKIPQEIREKIKNESQIIKM